ncbi:MAG: RidA family protein [Pseudomonadales bacterium]|jgi:enamine deaminase RidA (YjgF/YER057c/UK114 family)|nr:RidA family protein [Pseudomonadales bacterium]MDP7357933.1 RidA family protein [Pseudomonadales bacterium]MDP7595613.1 RidA family protein [Pseudomonadales bacterium]HJN50345.1 RidA family protein [Pseudomonadales bacterium]|tara:strand:+ start:2420 stop:2818 length:399 start_codon:yes stop_codon:yes gene_type:complete
MANFETVVPAAAKGSYDQFHFSEGVIANGMLFASGIIGTDASGNVPTEDKEEFRLAWQGITTLLEEAGSGLDRIVEYTSFHVDMMSHLGHFMSVRDEYLKEPWPAWTAIGVSSLARPGARVEIKVTAVLDRS